MKSQWSNPPNHIQYKIAWGEKAGFQKTRLPVKVVKCKRISILGIYSVSRGYKLSLIKESWELNSFKMDLKNKGKGHLLRVLTGTYMFLKTLGLG